MNEKSARQFPEPHSDDAPLPRSQESLFSRVNLWVYLIAASPLLIKLLCYPSYPGSDDAFIHLTIVRNLVHGLGWGINPGEPINVSSSPLYTVLVSLLSLIGLPAMAAGEWLSAVSGFLGLVFLHRLLGRLGLRPIASIGGVIVAAFNIYLWRWNGVVMETTLSLFLLTLAFWTYHGTFPGAAKSTEPQTMRYLFAGLVAGLATLTRFELGLVVGCFGLCEMGNRPPSHWWRSCSLLSVGFLAGIAPWFIYSHFVFHALLPTTFYAKTSAGLLLWNPVVGKDLLTLIASSDFLPILGILALLVISIRRGQPIAGFIRPRLDVFLFPLLLALFYYTKTPFLQSAARYFLPALHILAAVLACCFDAWSRTVPALRLRLATGAILTGHIILALVLNQWKVTPVLSRFETNYWRAARDAVDYLRSRVTPGERLNVLVEVDIGMLSYYAGDVCYFIDGGALATPSLRDKTPAQHVAETHPEFVAETLGDRVGGMIEQVPALRLVWHRTFQSHSLGQPNAEFTLNIYENPKPGQ